MTVASTQAAFSAREFGQVVALAIRAGQDERPVAAEAAENPYARAALALRQRYPDQPERFDAAFTRFTALMDLFVRNRLGPWVRNSAGKTDARDIHPAVVHVAAQMRLKRNGRFPERRFIEAVEQLVRHESAPEWSADDADGS